MVKETPFKLFITLVALDEKIRLLKKKVSDLSLKIVEINKAITQEDQNLLFAKNNMHQARCDVDEQELILKELDDSERKRRAQLDATSGYREYQSIQQELTAIHAQQQTQEEAVLHAWKHFETCEQLYAATITLHKEKVSELQKIIAEHTKSMESFETEIQGIMQLRPECERNVPDDWLLRYERMRGQVEDPVVPVLQESCGGCFNKLTSQDMIRARQGALFECKRCYRLLYLEEAIDRIALHGNSNESSP